MNRTHEDCENNISPILIPAKQVAAMLDVSPRTVWRLLSSGKIIRPVRIGRNVRWRYNEIRQWIDDGCRPPAEFAE